MEILLKLLLLIQIRGSTLLGLTGSGTCVPREFLYPNCNGCGVLLSLLTLLLCCYNPSVAAEANQCDSGVVIPRDPYVLTGQSLSLTCVKNVNLAGELAFRRARAGHTERLPDRYVQRVNSTAIKLLVPNVTDMEAETYTLGRNYLCVAVQGDREECVNNQYVMIERHPVVAKNLQCMVFNWDWMQCRWDLGVKYMHPNNTTVTCTYKQLQNTNIQLEYQDSFVAKENCPDMAPNKTLCTWDDSHFNDLPLFHVNITVTNTIVNVSVSTADLFQVEDIIKPSPVEGLQAPSPSTEMPGCYIVEWTHDRRCLLYITVLAFKSSCDQQKVRVKDKKLDPKEPCVNRSTLVCGLNPFTDYRLNVRTKAINESDSTTPVGYWSDNVTKHFKTSKSVPDRNPVGDLEAIGICSKGDNCYRIFIQPLSECQKHSETVVYQLLVNETVLHEIQDDQLFFPEMSLPNETVTRLYVRATSAMGPAIQELTEISVFPKNQRPVVPEFLVEYYGEEKGAPPFYNVSLLDNLLSPNISYTLYYCDLLSEGSNICDKQGSLHRVALPVNSSWYQVAGQGLLRFGLSAHLAQDRDSSEIISSGIHWAPCVYKHDQPPTKAPGNIRLDEAQSGSVVRVLWDKPVCEPRMQGYITHYQLIYCDVRHCEDSDITIVSVSNDVTAYTITEGLVTGLQYHVWVRAVTRGNHTGPANENPLSCFLIETEKLGAGFPPAVAVTLAVIISFALVALIPVCLRCRKTLKGKQYHVQPPDIQGIKMIGGPSDEEFQNRQYTMITDIGELEREIPRDSGTECEETSTYGSASADSRHGTSSSIDSAVYTETDEKKRGMKVAPAGSCHGNEERLSAQSYHLVTHTENSGDSSSSSIGQKLSLYSEMNSGDTSSCAGTLDLSDEDSDDGSDLLDLQQQIVKAAGYASAGDIEVGQSGYDPGIVFSGSAVLLDNNVSFESDTHSDKEILLTKSKDRQCENLTPLLDIHVPASHHSSHSHIGSSGHSSISSSQHQCGTEDRVVAMATEQCDDSDKPCHVCWDTCTCMTTTVPSVPATTVTAVESQDSCSNVSVETHGSSSEQCDYSGKLCHNCGDTCTCMSLTVPSVSTTIVAAVESEDSCSDVSPEVGYTSSDDATDYSDEEDEELLLLPGAMMMSGDGYSKPSELAGKITETDDDEEDGVDDPLLQGVLESAPHLEDQHAESSEDSGQYGSYIRVGADSKGSEPEGVRQREPPLPSDRTGTNAGGQMFKLTPEKALQETQTTTDTIKY